MRSIMNKVTRFLNNLSNASKIRDAYNKAHTVKKRLQRVNFWIVICIILLIATLFAVSVSTDNIGNLETTCVVLLFLVAIWLYGYRRAIALGQTNRQNYIANTRRRFRRICHALGCFFVVLLVLAIIAIVLMVLVEKYDFLVDVFPSLKGIADCTIKRMNVVLSDFLARIS